MNGIDSAQTPARVHDCKSSYKLKASISVSQLHWAEWRCASRLQRGGINKFRPFHSPHLPTTLANRWVHVDLLDHFSSNHGILAFEIINEILSCRLNPLNLSLQVPWMAAIHIASIHLVDLVVVCKTSHSCQGSGMKIGLGISPNRHLFYIEYR